MTITLTPRVEAYPCRLRGYCRLPEQCTMPSKQTGDGVRYGVAVGAFNTGRRSRQCRSCAPDDREQGQARSHAITQRAHLHVSPAKPCIAINPATPSQPPPPLLSRRARAEQLSACTASKIEVKRDCMYAAWRTRRRSVMMHFSGDARALISLLQYLSSLLRAVRVQDVPSTKLCGG